MATKMTANFDHELEIENHKILVDVFVSAYVVPGVHEEVVSINIIDQNSIDIAKKLKAKYPKEVERILEEAISYYEES